ncbi:hypothetical protein BDM02DRAFT_3186786 [Thelephora ganbajun]|uniref:Uncharacterized protein n=1 Tax=Thelephora ganbajun TaxID=370292 RepID=A0ACB6ZGY7_THEGA|nr:hypothetical protein BDM02DRAFT_3186786 [Thelephora ganbajun]
MARCPFDSNTHVKREIKTAEGLTFWFADVPEGGITENTYLSAVTSERGSELHVLEHFHPKSTEYFTIEKGEARFKLDGKDYVVKEGENFVIPRGVVHSVSLPKDKYVVFKVRGDHDPVAERDFLIEMFRLVETKQDTLLKMYTCWYKSGNFVPKIEWCPKAFWSIIVWLLGGVLGSFFGLGKADLKED